MWIASHIDSPHQWRASLMAVPIAALMRLPERLNPSSTSISRITSSSVPQERIGLDPADPGSQADSGCSRLCCCNPPSPWRGTWWAWPTQGTWDRRALRIHSPGREVYRHPGTPHPYLRPPRRASTPASALLSSSSRFAEPLGRPDPVEPPALVLKPPADEDDLDHGPLERSDSWRRRLRWPEPYYRAGQDVHRRSRCDSRRRHIWGVNRDAPFLQTVHDGELKRIEWFVTDDRGQGSRHPKRHIRGTAAGVPHPWLRIDPGPCRDG